ARPICSGRYLREKRVGRVGVRSGRRGAARGRARTARRKDLPGGVGGVAVGLHEEDGKSAAADWLKTLVVTEEESPCHRRGPGVERSGDVLFAAKRESGICGVLDPVIGG